MSKKVQNSGKRRKVEQDLAKAKNNKDYAKVIYDFKYLLNIQQWEVLLKKLNLHQKDIVFAKPLPKSFKDFRKINTFFSYDFLELEVLWLMNILGSYTEEINLFLTYKKEYESYLLKGEYKHARNTLEKIDSEICVSSWSIGQHFFTLEQDQGFKKNKEYLGELLDEHLDPLSSVLFRYQSVKAEKNLSALKYRRTIHDYSLKFEFPLIREYLVFQLDFFAKNQYSTMGGLLSLENNSSIIDRYEMLIQIFSLIVSDSSKSSRFEELIGNSASTLFEKIKDRRLHNLSLLCNVPTTMFIEEDDVDFIHILDLYTKGDYNSVIQQIQSVIEKYPYNIDLYKLYIKSILIENIEFRNFFPINCISNKILRSIYNIYSKNYENVSALLELHKLIVSRGVTSWTSNLNSLLIEENILYAPTYNHHIFNNLQLAYVNPQILFHTDRSVAKTLFEEYQVIGQKLSSNTIEFILNSTEGGANNNPSIPKFRRLLYEAESYCRIRDWSKGLDIFDTLSVENEFNFLCTIPFYFERIVQGKVRCLIEQKRFSNAISIITDACIQNENFISKLHSKQLIDFAINNDDSEIASDISIPIYLYFNKEHGGSLWAAYDNFLVTHDLTYPEEIEEKLSEFNRDKLVFFLDRVCVKEVYDSSYFYENQSDLDTQRIEVCLLLTRIDKDNSIKYIEEISSIDRDILIRKGIQQIDESKIYADTKGVKNSLGSELQENFNRYIELDTIPLEELSKIESDIDDVFVFFLEKKMDEVVDLNPSEVKLTSYNRFAYFTEMFYKIRDEFISSNDYGLETYLSMRIRHGTLLGIIRSVFETRHLITKKDSNKNEYNANHYWLDKFIFHNKELDRAKFNTILSDFSASIDNISDELKNKWLQMNIETKESEGLFDYNYHDRSTLLQLFQESMGKITDYNEFVDSVIEELWSKTEENLKVIRKFISDDVRVNMIGKLSQLQVDLETLKDDSPGLDFIELIREITSCKTAITQELSTISEWFKRTNNKTINDFDIKLPIEACLVTLKRIESNFSSLAPEIKVSSTTRFDGVNLTYFTDIMHIVIGNIIKHSQLEASELDVSIEIEEDEQKVLSILIKNKISPELDLEYVNNKIEKTIKLLKQKISVDKTRGEEGSGYLKLKKIVVSDLKRSDYNIEISPVNADYIFKTKIQFGLSGLEK